MALAIETITKTISRLDFGGVRARDVDEIPMAVGERDCPILFPEPAGFIANFEVVRDSAGTPSNARKTVNYTLLYTFLYAPVDQNRPGLGKFARMVDVLFEVLDVIINNDTITGLVDLWPDGIPEFGPIPDPAGNMFIGARIQLRVTEFIN